MKKRNPYHDESMWKGATPNLFERARILRENLTPAEKVLWEELKGNKLGGYKFRCQHPLQNYIVDLYCHAVGLIIEVDGGYHEKEVQKVKDQEREEILKFQQLSVLRFKNEEILTELSRVLKEIYEKVVQLENEKTARSRA